MYPVSAAWKAAVKSSDRIWAAKIVIETAFETFEVDETGIAAGTLRINEGVTEGSAFGIGYAYKDDLSFTLINKDGRFDDAQLNGAIARPYVGIEVSPGELEYVPLGVFVIDTVGGRNAAIGQASKISIEAFGMMARFERPFSKVSASFPCTALSLLTMTCQHCGVPLATADFLNHDYMIAGRPDEEMSCRDIVSCIAELAGCWARCDRYGRLSLDWFDNPAPVAEADLDGNPIKGKNIINPPIDDNGTTKNGMTLTYDPETQEFTANGTCTAYNTFWSFTHRDVIWDGSTYTYSVHYISGGIAGASGSGQGLSFGTDGWTTIINVPWPISGVSSTTQSLSGAAVKGNIRFDSGVTCNNYKFTIQGEKSAAATAWARYTLGDTVDGGTFTGLPGRALDGGLFAQAEPVDNLTAANRYDFVIDDAPLTITGVSLERDEDILLAGSDRYAIHITDNPLIQSGAEDVIWAIWKKLRTFAFLPYTSNWKGDPAMQAGDMITQADRKGNVYRTIVTQSTFVFRGKSVLMAGGKSESAAGYVDPMNRAVSRLRSRIQDKQVQIDAMDLAAQSLFALIAGMNGGHRIDGDTLDNPKYHGKTFVASGPDIEDANTEVWQYYGMGGIGFFPRGMLNPPSTAWGSDGTFLANLIVADMIRAGVLRGLTGDMQWDLNNNRITFGNGSIQFDSSGGITITSEDIRTVMKPGVPFAIEVYDGGSWVRKSWTDLAGLVTNKISNDPNGLSAGIGTFDIDGFEESGLVLGTAEGAIQLAILRGAPGFMGFRNREGKIFLWNDANASGIEGSSGASGGRVQVLGNSSANIVAGSSSAYPIAFVVGGVRRAYIDSTGFHNG